MIVISVVSTKGGVGKTTLTANLGSLLADLGLRVLLIDADVQPSLSSYFSLSRVAAKGLSAMIRQGSATPECISSIEMPGLSVDKRFPDHLRGTLDLVVSDAPEGTLQEWLASRVDRPARIKTALRNPFIDTQYDVVLIDTQGAVGPLQDASVLAADLLISPLCPDTLSAREFQGGTLEMIERLEPTAVMGFTVPPMKAVIYRTEHTTDSRAMAKAVRESFLEMRGRVSVLDTTVPSAVAYKNAATMRLPVHWIDPARAGDTMHRLVWELFPNLNGLRVSDVGEYELDESEAQGVAG